jgi:TonB family protein
MGISWGKQMIAIAATAVLAAAVISAQQSVGDEGKRKAKTKTNPQYSDLARKMNLSGRVKIEIVIAPDGRVKTARPIGGHPVLVQPCLDAVRDWRFESAPDETTQIVEFEFRQ